MVREIGLQIYVRSIVPKITLPGIRCHWNGGKWSRKEFLRNFGRSGAIQSGATKHAAERCGMPTVGASAIGVAIRQVCSLFAPSRLSVVSLLIPGSRPDHYSAAASQNLNCFIDWTDGVSWAR